MFGRPNRVPETDGGEMLNLNFGLPKPFTRVIDVGAILEEISTCPTVDDPLIPTGDMVIR